MKNFLIIALLIHVLVANAQPAQKMRETEEAKLITAIKGFHQALVQKNTVSINQQTDKALSYGHSNGWIETKEEMINHLETGYLSYNRFKEDSLNVVINGMVAHARFVADLNV